MPVRTGVTWGDGGVFVVLVLTPLVIGASVVHPVCQVSLQPLKQHRRDSLGNSASTQTLVNRHTKAAAAAAAADKGATR